MNIRARINARKIVLVYWYETYFMEVAGNKQILLDEIEKVDKGMMEKSAPEEVNLKEVMSNDYYKDVDTEIAYIREQCFEDVATKDIDFSYVKKIAPLFQRFEEEVRAKVNEHTVSFGYDEMDLVDRVIFVLGYAEYVELDTPKEVVLNEMVELAKRYGDESSSKLINGIGHKLLSSVDAEKGVSTDESKEEDESDS